MAQRFVGLCPRVCTVGIGLEYMRELVVSLDICGFEHLPTLREAQVVSEHHMFSARRGRLGLCGPTNRSLLLGCGI